MKDYTAEEIGKHFGVTGRAVRIWVREGKIPKRYFYRLPGGRAYRFRPTLIQHIRKNAA